MKAYVSAELVRSQKHSKQNTDIELEHWRQLFTAGAGQKQRKTKRSQSREKRALSNM